MAAYVEHRLTVAAARRPLFTPEGLERLAQRSAGVPRLINNLATQALFVGAMRRCERIDADLVADIADERT